MRFVAATVVIATVVISAMIGRFSAWACSSGEEFPGSLEDELCELIDGSSSVFRTVAVLSPAVLYFATQLVPGLRARALAIAIALSVLSLAFWVTVGAITIDV